MDFAAFFLLRLGCITQLIIGLTTQLPFVVHHVVYIQSCGGHFFIRTFLDGIIFFFFFKFTKLATSKI